MKVIMLAAGRGARLRRLTETKPKPLIQVGERPLLGWLLDVVAAAGLSPPVLITGYRAEEFEIFGLETRRNYAWRTSNIVSSLLCARDILRAGPTLVSYTDILYHPDDLMRLAATSSSIAVAYDPLWADMWSRRFVDPLTDAETFKVDRKGRITDIGGRPDNIDAIDGQYVGLLKFEPEGWMSVERVLGRLDAGMIKMLDTTSLLRRCILEHSVPIQGVAMLSPWCEIDLPSDIEFADAVLTRIGESMKCLRKSDCS